MRSGCRKWLREVSWNDCPNDGAFDCGSEKPPPPRNLSQAVYSLFHLLKKWDRDADLHFSLCLSALIARNLDRRNGIISHRSSPYLDSTNRRKAKKHDLINIVGEIPAVESFSIRLREGKPVSIRAVRSLCSSLLELEELCFQDLDHDHGHVKHGQIAELTPEFPMPLKRLNVICHGSREPKSWCRFLVQRLVWFGTAPLQELSITTSGNTADEFFEHLSNLIPKSSTSNSCYWPALQSLNLACSLLEPGAPHSAVNRLLHRAGMTALDLPRLRELRLFTYSIRRQGGIDGNFHLHHIAEKGGRDMATCFGKSTQHTSKVPRCAWCC